MYNIYCSYAYFVHIMNIQYWSTCINVDYMSRTTMKTRWSMMKNVNIFFYVLLNT